MSTPPPAGLPAGFAQSISRDELARLPVRRYEGEVCLVSGAAALERAMDDIRSEGALGFDTETRPAFVKGTVHLPCLVQAATARAVYLFQLRQGDFFAALAEMLGAPGIVKAGVSVADDLRALKQVFSFSEQSVVDLGTVAKQHGLRQTGVRNLAGLLLGIRVPKGTKTSNWAAPRLSSAQIGYAATDAWVCRELFLCFGRLGLLGPALPGRTS